MSAGAPWSVKGIDPKAREVAKDLARRSGMTLGEWLNRVILEDDVPEEVASEAQMPGRRPTVVAIRQRPTWSPPAVAGDIGAGAGASNPGSPNGSMRLEAQAEAAGPRSPLALRALERARTPDPEALVEAVLSRLDERLAGSEARTAAVIGDLKGALSAMDARLAAVERGGGSGGGQLEAQLAEVSEQVRAVERRSAQAVERMGHEVLRMAGALNRQLEDSDQRSAMAIEQVGGEIARIAGAVEARLARAEHAQAEALERLGVEVGRITDRFTERLAASERRAVEAIDHVGEQVARVTERIEQRHDRATTDFAERIRQSEARTTAMLNAAGPRIEAPPAPEPEPSADTLASPPVPEPELAPQPSPFAEDVALADGFAPIPEPEDDIFDVEAVDEAEAPREERPLSTREVIDRARAAARAAQEIGSPAGGSARPRGPPRSLGAAVQRLRDQAAAVQFGGCRPR